VAERPDLGVLLLQLGTPAEPTESSVREYLKEFLSDRRVIDTPRAIWLPILHLSVLRTRPAQSAALYQKIWTKDGSPLLVISDQQARAVESLLASRDGVRAMVRVGMRYGQPSIARALEDLLTQGLNRIVAVPMYPQYAGASTGSSLERLFDLAARRRVVPSISVVPPYFDDERYIRALAAITRETVEREDAEKDHLVISYHGLPKRFADEGDPYRDHCEATTEKLVCALGWNRARFTMTYQSQFGKEEWLGPKTDIVLDELAESHARVVVVNPGFTADCLETIEEIGMTGRERFLERGGEKFTRVPCLNDHPEWIHGLANLITNSTHGGNGG
jgi:ferrochelatase